MTFEYIAAALFVAFMVYAWGHVQRARHPDARPLAAYMIFMVVFSTVAVLLFVFLSYLAAAVGAKPAIDQPIGGVLLLLISFGPAFLIAEWQLKFPPRRPPDME